MKFLFLSIILLVTAVGSCDDDITQQEELEQINDLFDQMREMAVSVDCSTTEMSEWRITPVGAKACGGPIGYMPYHPSIDTTAFLDLVEVHRIAQTNYNVRWNIISDCAIQAFPSGVGCEEKEPILLFD